MIFFCSNLKHLRLKKGWKQDDLAVKLGVKANTISNYENNVSAPDFAMLEEIIKLFDITADAILFKDLTVEGASLILEEAGEPYGSKSRTFDFMQEVLNKIGSMEKEIQSFKTELIKK